MIKEFKIYDGDATVTYEETPEKKQQLWDEFIKFCQKHNATDGEACQNDNFLIEAPYFMLSVIDDIVKFETKWED